MPRTMHFHDLEHTLAVTRTALALGQALKLDTADLSTLEVAALFHVTGYAKVYQGHEEASAELARAYLQRIGANKREIAKFKREIVERIEEKISEHAGSNVD